MAEASDMMSRCEQHLLEHELRLAALEKTVKRLKMKISHVNRIKHIQKELKDVPLVSDRSNSRTASGHVQQTLHSTPIALPGPSESFANVPTPIHTIRGVPYVSIGGVQDLPKPDG